MVRRMHASVVSDRLGRSCRPVEQSAPEPAKASATVGKHPIDPRELGRREPEASHTCVSAIETSRPAKYSIFGFSSSNDGADPIGLRGRATDHYPMLKNSASPFCK